LTRNKKHAGTFVNLLQVILKLKRTRFLEALLFSVERGR